MKEEDKFAPSIIRLGILLLLFDVYLTWARIERQSVPDADSPDGTASRGNFGRLAQQPIVFQYMFFRTCAPPCSILFRYLSSPLDALPR
ncbi:hypothetical protein VTG60DRAFT_6273 [Thermothelomyces hinnuleus]